MNLFLIRHAESANNRLAESVDYAQFIATRTSDPEITERGAQQASALAAHLAGSLQPEFVRHSHAHLRGYGITRLACSPMLRTLQTAQPVAQALGLPIEVWADIFEQGGIFEGDPTGDTLRSYAGMSRAQMVARFGPTLQAEAIGEAGWWRGGYEEPSESEVRAHLVADRLTALAAAEPNAHLALVTHGTFLKQLLCALLHVPATAPVSFFHANTGITRIEFAPDGFRTMRYTNRTEHLPPALLTR